MFYDSFKNRKIGKTVCILMLQILLVTTVFSLIPFTQYFVKLVLRVCSQTKVLTLLLTETLLLASFKSGAMQTRWRSLFSRRRCFAFGKDRADSLRTYLPINFNLTNYCIYKSEGSHESGYKLYLEI